MHSVYREPFAVTEDVKHRLLNRLSTSGTPPQSSVVFLGINMANDIQMGEPKADVHAPDMISEAISKPEEATGQEATPMAVEAAAAAGATDEATTEAVVGVNTEAAVEATPQATTEATPEAAAEATTTEATPQATTEASTEASTEAKTEGSTEAKTETKTAAVADGAEGSHAPSGGDDAVVDEVSVVVFCG